MNRYDIALGKKPVPKPAAVVVPILRGSPEISSNRTSYVDLNQIATGNGSEGNPLNYMQFNSAATTTIIGPVVVSTTSTGYNYTIATDFSASTDGNHIEYYPTGSGTES
jgi:hypothetical protein